MSLVTQPEVQHCIKMTVALSLVLVPSQIHCLLPSTSGKDLEKVYERGVFPLCVLLQVFSFFHSIQLMKGPNLKNVLNQLSHAVMEELCFHLPGLAELLSRMEKTIQKESYEVKGDKNQR